MANDIWTPPTNWNAGTDFTEAKAEQEITDDMYALWLAVTGDGSAVVPHQHLYDTHANRPAFGNAGRLFFASDQPYTIELDIGTAWVVIGARSTVRVLDANHTVVTWGNTAAQQVLYTYTIPAGNLAVGGGFRLTIGGGLVNNSGVNRTIVYTLAVGGLTQSSNAITMSAGAWSREWGADFNLIIRDANEGEVSGRFIMGSASGGNFHLDDPSVSSEQYHGGVNFAMIGANLTVGAVVVELRSQMSAAHAAFYNTKRFARLELLPAP